MKKLLVLLCLLAAVSPAFGQATNFQRQAMTFSFTLDSTDAETLAVGIPANRGKGLFLAWVRVDTLKANTKADSITIKYRPSWATFDTAAYTGTVTGMSRANAIAKYAAWVDGAVMDWSWAQIYHGPSGALQNFNVPYTQLIPYANSGADSSLQDCSGGKIPVVFDMDGYPWRSLQIVISNSGGKDLTSSKSDDSIKVVIDFDID